MSDGGGEAALAIAEDWNVDVDALLECQWELETIDGNDGEVYGYLVRFADDTPTEMLRELGIPVGELTRSVTLNAFDGPEEDDPEAVLDGRHLTSRYLVNENGDALLTEKGERILVAEREEGGSANAELELFRRKLSAALDDLDETIGSLSRYLPPRAHNRPPELIEPEPLSEDDIRAVTKAARALRFEVSAQNPDPSSLLRHAGVLSTISSTISGWVARKVDLAVDTGIKWGVPIGLARLTPEKVQEAIDAVIRAATELAQVIGSF